MRHRRGPIPSRALQARQVPADVVGKFNRFAHNLSDDTFRQMVFNLVASAMPGVSYLARVRTMLHADVKWTDFPTDEFLKDIPKKKPADTLSQACS